MKILIIRLSSLGDIILTQPICALLQKAFPQAELHYLCKPAYAELPGLFDPPLQVIPYQPTVAFHLELRKQKYDLLIDLHGKLASFILRFTIGAKKFIAYNKQRAMRKAIVDGNRELNIESTVSLYASCLPLIGIKDKWTFPRLKTPAKDEKSQKLSTQAQTIAIFPGATHFTKRYPAASWVTLVNHIKGYKFALFGSSNDFELCESIKGLVKQPCVNYAGNLNIESLIKHLQDCTLIISGDTGPMHLAAGIRKPQIAIFGGTHPRLGFKPLNDNAVVLCANLPCQPCSLHGVKECHLKHFNCMKQIKAEMILDAVHSLLGKAINPD